jgi:hypothetical protein
LIIEVLKGACYLKIAVKPNGLIETNLILVDSSPDLKEGGKM